MTGIVALLIAAAAAGWLLVRAARNDGSDAAAGDQSEERRNVLILKGVIWLSLVAALFAAKLFPLAFMLLLAAGGITAIEIWRDRAIKAGSDPTLGAGAPARTRKEMKAEEAASILGVSVEATSDEVKSAHKKLISQLHPDKGGTDYLAAQINDARDALLKATAPVADPSDS